ncbi:MBL fold metallo-hydrolase [Candidatus Saganbacteria bacterium]|nr:MBL fold metallo-hydrolase [Candidatus Saganbacteria bacterium]
MTDYDQAIEIADKVYWIGFYDKASNLHCNPYLIIDNDEAIIIDPGSVPHFPIVARKTVSLIEPKKISHIIISHTDPDIAGALPVFEDLISNTDTKIIATTSSAHWITFYGTRSPFYYINTNEYKVKFRSGRELLFVGANYLHTFGVFATYDTKSKILFTSDIFGAYSDKWDLYATEEYKKKMESFHAHQMPSRDILRHALEKFEKLDIEMIAPQHGSIIKKEYIKDFIGFLKNVECGLDL